ncbi:binding-protein-dependent transport systems inner membrane component [Desulforamulus reducens MI-1]|uniref:Binding-protein-dependent transport systems inner membrane component n=1 Tax=Desulforamulus reducens (strain ATCC BAA-1160 / DSM 100696 / MI-1) TaxID=349161 RepID=A4J4T8_DESRM|nr:ABC transporter permease [Desulforamulus reducens]ABO50091.1 binding-protein-dependent transport systems inner membrane component [Desulforamulus reducens MI-1]
MNLRTFLMKRLMLSIFVIVGLSIVIFVISRVVPGDPARMALGSKAPQFAVDALRQEMYLDKPLISQYVYWAKGVVTGDLGKSLITKRAVLEDVQEFLPATLELALFAGVIMVLFSIIFGALAAKYRDTWIDTLIRIMAYSGVAMPSFVLAVLFLLLFGYIWPIIPVLGRLSTDVLPPPSLTGLITIDSLLTGNLAAFWDGFKHLILPSLALAIGPLFQEARLIRSAMTDNMNKDYVTAVTGYGIPSRIIMRKYLLKPSLIPAVSVMGLDLAALMGNAFLVEVIFNWPGISRYGMNAMLQKDLNAISAVIIVFGCIFVLVNIIVDFIVAYLDPRIRLGGKI